MLGDGGIQQGSLRVEQSVVRAGWLKDLQRDLASLGLSSKLDPVCRPEKLWRGRKFKEYHGLVLRTPSYRELRPHISRWYPDRGPKCVPQDVRITPRSTALWISGDGTGRKSGGLVLCTDGFLEPDLRLLVARLFDVFGIRPRLIESNRIGIFRKGDVVTLKSAVLPFMSDCCVYKFAYARAPQKRGRFNPAEIFDIRKRCDSKETLASIARQYGVSRSAINNIGLRKCYQWI